MGSFLEKLKKFYRFEMPSGLSRQDATAHFNACASAAIKTRLDAISDWLDETDSLLTEFFDRHFVAADLDAFSTEFNRIVEGQVELWVLQDESLRRRFREYVQAHKKLLKSTAMLAELDERYDALRADMERHVRKANEYGARWTKRADVAGLQIVSPKARATIQWFTNLTTDELERDYRREIKP